MSKKLNGYAKWITTAIAIIVLAFNTIETYSNRKTTEALINNEIKHLQEDVGEIKTDISGIQKYLLERK